MTWKASVDDDWNEPGNWSCYGLPTTATDVDVSVAALDPAGAMVGPAIDNIQASYDAFCRTLGIDHSSGTITVTVNADASLQVATP
jgi:hypothetical protein